MFLAVFLVYGMAYAQPAGDDVDPGDKCASYSDGAARMVADADGDYVGTVLICKDGTWTRKTGMQLSESSSPCTAGRAGSLRYNSDVGAVELCSNLEWKLLIAEEDFTDPEPPVTDPGYFVLTNGTWNGDLQAEAGDIHPNAVEAADQLCLTDLTNNNWMGKSDAQTRSLIDATHVKSFICDKDYCNIAVPNETYLFAVSGDPTSGGARFTANASGLGPGNSQNWAGKNYFDGFKTYWTGRDTVDDQTWSTDAGPSFQGAHCGYTGFVESTGQSGWVGETNANNDERWHKRGAPCVEEYNLICFVHP